jgi:hypothetical protein
MNNFSFITLQGEKLPGQLHHLQIIMFTDKQ